MANEIRVLIVDDSAFARLTIARELRNTSGIAVVDFARTGLEALEKIRHHRPDVVTLDVEMPHMNGLETLKRIMAESPTPVLMLSNSAGSGTEATLKALELGAVDFFPKNLLANPTGSKEAADTFRNKIMMASKVKAFKQSAFIEPSIKLENQNKKKIDYKPADVVVVIGSSTGGPKALYQILPDLPADIAAAILIVQHMPPGFTKSLADRLNQISRIGVKEAAPGDDIYQGMAYIARGGYHMVIDNNGALSLTQTDAVNGLRPSVNVTMKSVVDYYGGAVLGVVLTGMGTDGTAGAQEIKRAGGRVLVQDEATCVVYGMPKSIAESGYADAILPISGITNGIVESLKSYPQGAKSERSRVCSVNK